VIPSPAIGEIVRDFLQPLTVQRRGLGAKEKGRYFPGDVTTIAIEAAVYPANGDDIRLLAQAVRTDAAIVVFTETELRTASEPSGNDADAIAYGGKQWEVHTAEPWTYGAYWRCVAVKRAQSAIYAPVYYGVGPSSLSTEAQIQALAGKLVQNQKGALFSVTPGLTDHIFYAYPSSFGLAEFQVGQFAGGFSFVGVVTVAGLSYNLFRSAQPNLGLTTVQVR
jgi:hypothetical protein